MCSQVQLTTLTLVLQEKVVYRQIDLNNNLSGEHIVLV